MHLLPFLTPTARRSTRAWRSTFRRRIPTPAKTCSSCRRTAGRWCCSCCWRAASRRPARSTAPAARLPGLRLAEPGEFTERAFLNDKLDLAQAEAVADLIDASTEAAARSAGRSLRGAFSREIDALRDALVELRMLVEATLDFPEEEIDFLEKADARGPARRASRRSSPRCCDARAPGRAAARRHHGGAGRPAQRRQELAAECAGRRRAGDRDADPGHHARQGQRRRSRSTACRCMWSTPPACATTRATRSSASASRAAGTQIERADAVLFLHDLTRARRAGYAPADARIAERAAAARAARRCCTCSTSAMPAPPPAPPAQAAARCRRGPAHGLDALRAARCWSGRLAGRAAKACSSRAARHVQALRARRTHLARGARRTPAAATPALELLAEELRLAHDALGEITGQFSADDLLGEIFSRFCIGK